MSLEDRISYLENIHRNFQIVGGSNVTVEGSLRQGYAICSTCPQQEEPAVPQPAPPSPPPPATGACCIGTDCSITTEADCIASGGTYQGDSTVCDPNPCGCVGEMVTFQIDYAFTLSVDDTRCPLGEPCDDASRCALHFSDGGSISHTVTETLPSWGEFFMDFDFSDPACPVPPSGICSRVGAEAGHDYFGGTVGVNIGAGLVFCGCTCVCADVNWSFGCEECSEDCNCGGPCGSGDGSFKTQDIPDLCHPEGSYSFSDSHSETHYSWAWTLDFTITRL